MTHIEQMIKDMCPNGVEWKYLTDVANVLYGYPFEAEKFSEDERNIPLIRIRDVVPAKASTYYTGTYPKEYIIKAGDILVGMDGNFNLEKWKDRDGLLNQRVCKIYSKNADAVLDNFLYHLLKPLFKKIEDEIKGGTVKHLSAARIKQIEIPLPPIEIQKKIVECLDKFSALAAELQAELQKRRTQYEYYRTQLLTPPQSISPEGSTDDRNWEWKTFAELGTLYSGLSGKSKEDFKDGNAKFITYLNIGCNPALRLDIYETVKIGSDEKQNIVQYGDALFTGSSETPDECAMSSVVTEQPTENLYLNSFCFGFRFNSLNGICPSFYKHYFRCDAFRKAVRKTANGTTRFNVSKKEFAKLSIPIPSLAEQARIVSILDKFEALTTSLSDGIPAEQIMQQKRYEYYRDLLLTFQKVEK